MTRDSVTIRREIFGLQRERDRYKDTLRNAKAAGRKAGAKAARWAIKDTQARIDALQKELIGAA